MREYLCGLNLAITLAATAICVPAHAESQALPSTEKAITILGRVQRTAGPNVFGTVAVPFGTTPMSARWTRVTSASASDPSLVRLTGAARGLGGYQRVAFINSVVNRGVRNHSSPKCTDDGYWASARESLARGIGDCVDIAIAKMEALRQLGVPERDLFLVTGRKFGNDLEAALLVRVGDQYYLLDSRSSAPMEAGQASSFTPIVTYGVGMTWAHGVRVSNPRTLTKSPMIAQASQPKPVEPARSYSGIEEEVKSSVRSLAPVR